MLFHLSYKCQLHKRVTYWIFSIMEEKLAAVERNVNRKRVAKNPFQLMFTSLVSERIWAASKTCTLECGRVTGRIVRAWIGPEPKGSMEVSVPTPSAWGRCKEGLQLICSIETKIWCCSIDTCMREYHTFYIDKVHAERHEYISFNSSILGRFRV